MSWIDTLKTQRFRPAMASVAIAAALGLTALGAVTALAQSAPPAHSDRNGMPDGHGPGRAMEWFKTKLKLTPEQAKLWDAAAEKMRLPEGARAKMRAAHEQYLGALMDPSFDPRQWIAEEDKERAEREVHMKEVRSAWLAVWDSLDASQRTQVREFLVQRAQHGHRVSWRPHENRGGPGDHAQGGPDGAHLPNQ